MNLKRRILPLFSLLLWLCPTWAQNVGDHATAGYTSSRTYLNSDQGDFSPPLTQIRTVDLGETSAGSLLVFENSGFRSLLVGETVAEGVRYRLLDSETGAVQWTQLLPGGGGAFNYVPSYAGDIVLLGGSTTTAVRAVQVSSGQQLWQDSSLGATQGRYPVLTGGLALYHGRNLIRAAAPNLGPSGVFWQFAASTAEAPISVFGQRAYALEASGNLRSFDVNTGESIWTVPNLMGVNPGIIATEDYVFINNTASRIMGAVTTATPPAGAWSRPTGTLSQTPALALAYDRLYVFTSQDDSGDARVTALNPDTGAPLWEVIEPGGGIDYGLVANNVLYYYHQASQRIRARDAFTGNLIGTVNQPGVRALSASGGLLYVLLAGQVEVYRGGGTIYFAHLADGGGQRTLLTITNNNPSAPATGTATFFAVNGSPLALALEDFGVTSDVAFEIPAGGSIGLQSMGAPGPRAGWIRVTADQPISGSEVFQFVDGETGLIRFEAGVADSRATGRARTFVQLFFPPDRPSTISTGVAVANISETESTEVIATLLDPLGIEAGETSFTLGPRGQRAQFLQQLFEVETFSGFVGTLVIRSNLPVVVTALRTQAGLQLSSLPVGQ